MESGNRLEEESPDRREQTECLVPEDNFLYSKDILKNPQLRDKTEHTPFKEIVFLSRSGENAIPAIAPFGAERAFFFLSKKRII